MAVACFFLWFVLLLASLHPFTTYPLSLALFQRLNGPTRLGGSAPEKPLSFAICVCAYNEEKVIESKAQNLLALRSIFPNIEILVYVDAASDRTTELLSTHSDQMLIVNAKDRHGKTVGMNQLVSMTQADIVIFSDANVIIDIDSVKNLPAYFRDPQVGCVCGHLRYHNADDSATASTGTLYWKLEEWTKRLETECGGAIGADGSFFAIRRALHQPPPAHIIDDFFVSMKIILEGASVVQAENVIVYERSASNPQEEYLRKVRIGCQSFNVHRLLWPALRRLPALTLYKYLSHKLMRWICGYVFLASGVFLELGLLFAEVEVLAIALPMVAVICYGLGALAKISPFSNLWDIFMSIMATGIGVWKSIRGEVFQTWVPPASARSHIP